MPAEGDVSNTSNKVRSQPLWQRPQGKRQTGRRGRTVELLLVPDDAPGRELGNQDAVGGDQFGHVLNVAERRRRVAGGERLD
jgi:hypothetical protein